MEGSSSCVAICCVKDKLLFEVMSCDYNELSSKNLGFERKP